MSNLIPMLKSEG